MSDRGWRLVAWVWLVLQILEGGIATLIPIYAFGEVLKGQAHGALILMIGASCLGPVALATWGGSNRLLAWGTAAAAFFTFTGAAITVWDLLTESAVVWIVFNIYAVAAVVPFVVAVLYIYRVIRRRVREVTPKSSAAPQSELTLYVSHREAAGSALSLPRWFHIAHFLNFPISSSQPVLPRWFYVTHFLNNF